MTSTDATRAVKALWWLVLLRGVLAVIFGLYALFQPETALLALIFVYGFYAIFDGVAALVVGFRNRGTSHWGWHLAQGVVSLIAGAIALFWPGPTVLALVLIIAVWSIVLGVTQIVEAFTARRQGSPSWVWLLVGGIERLQMDREATGHRQPRHPPTRVRSARSARPGQSVLDRQRRVDVVVRGAEIARKR